MTIMSKIKSLKDFNVFKMKLSDLVLKTMKSRIKPSKYNVRRKTSDTFPEWSVGNMASIVQTNGFWARADNLGLTLTNKWNKFLVKLGFVPWLVDYVSYPEWFML